MNVPPQKYFVIARVSRLDVQETLHLTSEQANNISDQQMLRLAEKMANDYMEQLYWTSLTILAEDIIEVEGDDDKDDEGDEE